MMRKWVKAIICGCLFYEFGLWFGMFLAKGGEEWIQLVINLMAQTMAVMCGILMLLLYDKEE